MIAILVRAKWCLIVVLVYASLTTRSGQHLPVCSLAIPCIVLMVANYYGRIYPESPMVDTELAPSLFCYYR